MIKRYLTNAILIGLVIGLYWFNTADKSVVDEMPQLSTLTSSQIQHITISQSNSPDIVLEKSTSGWQITQPIQAIANDTRVELVLSFLNTPSYAQIIVDSDKNLAQFELEPADLVLTLDSFIVKFGGVEPISKHRYVLIDNTIHLITDRVTPLLRANASSFIENKLIPKAKIITKISLPQLNADNSLSTDSPIIIENNDGHWQSNNPTLTSNQLTAFVENWQHAYALQVQLIKDNSPITTPSHTVQIWFDNQTSPTEYELKLNNTGLLIIDALQQLNYQFSSASLTQLLPSTMTKQ